jgi:CBS domain containing-hemolysin-like protein
MPLIVLSGLLVICFAGAFFFAGTETGFVSWNPLKVGHLAGKGHLTAKWALYLMNHKDRLLLAVLIGNNICVVGASLVFVAIIESIDNVVPFDLKAIPSPESWLLTPFVVLFCDMIPKSLFRIYSFKLTMRSVPILYAAYLILFPFTWMVTSALNLFRKNGLQKDKTFMAKVREEMVMVAAEGSKEGTLFESADVFIDSILKLKDRCLKEIMIPLEDWQKKHKVVRSNERIKALRDAFDSSNEIIVFDSTGNIPCGFVNLTDLAIQNNNEPLKNHVRILYRLDGDMSLLAGLQKVSGRAQKYFIICEKGGKPQGILDKIILYQAVFGKLSPDFNPAI